MVLGRYPNRECVTCGKNADFSFFEIFRENRERRTCNTRIVRAIVIAISILSYIKNTPIIFHNSKFMFEPSIDIPFESNGISLGMRLQYFPSLQYHCFILHSRYIHVDPKNPNSIFICYTFFYMKSCVSRHEKESIFDSSIPIMCSRNKTCISL